MAAFEMPIDPNDPGYKRVRLMMSPRTVTSMIENVLSTLWMTLPINERSMMALESAARLMFVEVLEDWRSTPADDRPNALVQRSNAVATDPSGGSEADITVAGESADEAKFRQFFSVPMARYQLFNGLLFASMMAPLGQRDDISVESYVRRVFERQLVGWWDDARDLQVGVEG